MQVGSTISFRVECENEKDKREFPDGIDADYTVKATDGKFVIVTKPCPERDTVWYSILDLEAGIRGPNDRVFDDYVYAEQADIDRCLADLQSGKIGISYRNRVKIEIAES